MNLSVIIIAFKSDHLLDKLIKSFPKKFQIIVKIFQKTLS